MAILQNNQNVTPELIKDKFPPFKNPDTIDGLLIGNDLDSLLSACLLKTKFGWNVFGIYDLETIWYDETIKDFLKRLLDGRILAIDLDIYHQKIPSVGHHILAMNSKNKIPRHALSLNPNLIRGIDYNSFKRKYPLGTIHLLLWILQETAKINEATKPLVWLCDSSYINGQSHRYRGNVEDWINNFFKDPIFIKHFLEIDKEAFENDVKSLIDTIAKTGISTSRGQVSSKHLRLRGGQCQFKDPRKENENIRKMMELIRSISSWDIPDFPRTFGEIKGTRHTDEPRNVITDRDLDRFLEEYRVFSYVFPNHNKINYTNGFSFLEKLE